MDIDAIRDGFGARLVQERHRLGCSQADLARLAGVSKPTQLAYEQGSRVPGLDYLLRMSAAGMDHSYLLFGTPDKVRVMQSFDWQLMGEILEAIEQWALDNSLSLTQTKRVELSRVIYQLGISKTTLEPGDVERVLKLVA